MRQATDQCFCFVSAFFGFNFQVDRRQRLILQAEEESNQDKNPSQKTNPDTPGKTSTAGKTSEAFFVLFSRI